MTLGWMTCFGPNEKNWLDRQTGRETWSAAARRDTDQFSIRLINGLILNFEVKGRKAIQVIQIETKYYDILLMSASRLSSSFEAHFCPRPGNNLAKFPFEAIPLTYGVLSAAVTEFGHCVSLSPNESPSKVTCDI